MPCPAIAAQGITNLGGRMTQINLVAQGKPIAFEVKNLVIAGWTGRDKAAVEHHIKELEAIGVARPKSTPCYYRVAEYLLSTDESFQFAGNDSSGEVEFVLYSTADGLYVGLGSDHTDRKVESYGVTVSKQMCAKPVSKNVWKYSDIKDHWDQITTRSWVMENNQKVLYQEGAVARMLSPEDLIKGYTGGSDLPVGTVMFCGTHAVKGDLRWASKFMMEMQDPVSGQTIQHSYECQSLPIND